MCRQIHILQQRRVNVAQFSSKVTAARPKSPSLRTTIPEAVVKFMELEAGDEILWAVNLKAKAVEVSVTKA